MSVPNVMYAFWANGYGSAFTAPQKVVRDGGDVWWHKGEDHYVKREGLEDNGGHICFAHRDKKRVQDFIDGFNASRRLMSNFVLSGLPKKSQYKG